MASTLGDGLFSPGRRTLTFGLVLTITLVAFESLAISTVMPLVAQDLGGLELYGWVFSAFFLASIVGIVVIGGLLDRSGLVRPMAVSLLLFGIGLLMGGLAPAMPVLVVARFIQGLGAGAVGPTVYVAIGRSMPERLRPRMFAIMSTAWVLPGVIGPAVAGVIGETVGWRWVFLGLLPLIVVSGSMTLRALRGVAAAPPSEHLAAEAVRRRLPLALLVAAGSAAAVAGLTSGVALLAAVLVPAGVALGLPAFRRLSPPGTLRLRPGLPAAIGLRGVLTFAFFSVDVYVALLLIDYREVSAFAAGLALTAATIAWTAGSWTQARRIEVLGAAWFVRLGFLVVATGIATTMLVLIPAVPWQLAIVTVGVAGLGMGLSYAPLALYTLRMAAPGTQGSATSALQLSDTLGIALGTGIAGAFVAAGERSGAEPWIALAAAFGMGAIVAAAGSLAAGRMVARLPAAPSGAAAD